MIIFFLGQESFARFNGASVSFRFPSIPYFSFQIAFGRSSRQPPLGFGFFGPWNGKGRGWEELARKLAPLIVQLLIRCGFGTGTWDVTAGSTLLGFFCRVRKERHFYGSCAPQQALSNFGNSED